MDLKLNFKIKVLILTFIVAINIGIGVNAQKAYSTEEELVEEVLQIFKKLPDINNEQWAELFLPSFKLAITSDEKAINEWYNGVSESKIKEFCQERYSFYSNGGRFSQNPNWDNIKLKQFIKNPDRGYQGTAITGLFMKIYITHNEGLPIEDIAGIEVSYFKYQEKYYLFIIS